MAGKTDSEIIGQMRSDLIDMSYRLPKGDAELPRLWNVAYDALKALEDRLRTSTASTRRDQPQGSRDSEHPAGHHTPDTHPPPSPAS